MDTKSFLTGYFYAAFQLHNHNTKEQEQYSADFWFSQMHLYTVSGGKLIIGINRGICPIGGNVPFAFSNTDKSAFDVVKHWTTPEIWEYICTIHEDQGSEVRMYLDEIVSIIDYFGGLDLNKMKTEILNIKQIDSTKDEWHFGVELDLSCKNPIDYSN